MLFRGTDSLWISWIRQHVLKEKSFWTVKVQLSRTWSWRKILKLRDVYRPMLKHVVGNGRRIHLWYDNWYPDGTLLLKYMRVVYDLSISKPYQPQTKQRYNLNNEVVGFSSSSINITPDRIRSHKIIIIHATRYLKIFTSRLKFQISW